MNQLRRSFLYRSARLLAALVLSGMHTPLGLLRALSSDSHATDPQAEPLIRYSSTYLTSEMPMDLLASWITPSEHFFIRNNLLMPKIDIEQWRLRVTGEVLSPLELTFSDLQKFQSTSVINTLECAGNGRAFFHPRIEGVPWRRGAVGNATFSGARLRDLLQAAVLKPTAQHVAFKGLDLVPEGSEQFIRSIPIAKAMDPNTLLASSMNGAALMLEHGYPVRALVPGWIGSCSIKWLSEVRVLEREFEGFYMRSAYRIPERTRVGHRGPGFGTVITSIAVKSIIAHPQDGAVLPLLSSGTVRVGGAAWAGEKSITQVDISPDGGHSWCKTALGNDQSKYAWRLWEYDWKPRAPGSYLLLSRATDQDGNVQPHQPRWNPYGYLWNGIDRIRLKVLPA